MTTNQAPVPPSGDRLAHGFRRTLFGFSPSKMINPDKYGYLFGVKSIGSKFTIPYTQLHRDVLEELGRQMLDLTSDDDPAELSTLDAGYTYFGQFVDHDLTLDARSSMNHTQDARKLINFRTPNLDLDSVYAGGPAVSPFMYDENQLKFVVGYASNMFDLPRAETKFSDPKTRLAIIGDPRNDENLFVAQFHMSMLRFHNAVVDQLQKEKPETTDPGALFEEAQKEVRRHYQWVVIHDYLRTIVGDNTLTSVLDGGLISQLKRGKFFMPVEFSVAAYRFGHSMVRNTYRFNRNFNTGFFSAFDFTKKEVPGNWVIDWSGFFSEASRPAANKARKIDTRVALSMGSLPTAPNMPSNNMFAILSARNLVRGMALQVPSGQAIAKFMGIQPLTSDELLGTPYSAPTPAQSAHHDETVRILNANDQLLLIKTPLWYYILKEAEVLNQGNQLGPVGGRIVAEVFYRVLADSPDSIVNNADWTPRFGLDGKAPADYKIIDLLKFAETFHIASIS